jgi:hypothetical protein
LPEQAERNQETVMLEKDAQTTLNMLRWHWEQAYAVNCDGPTWTAIPAAAPEVVLSAGTGMELRTLMQHDYAARAIRCGATAARWAGGCST